jgi:MFS family permease
MQFSMLYTVYSLPNLILPLVGGILLDILGIRTGMILFCSILFCGQAIFTAGGATENYNMMLGGRAVFGCGAESMSVAQSSIVSVWFKGKELAFALGVNLSVARLGSVINAAIIPTIYAQHGLGLALGLGLILCGFSLLNAFGIMCVDKKAEEEEKQLAGSNAEVAQVGDDSKFKLSDILNFKISYWLLTGSCVLTYMSVFPYIQVASDLLQTKYGFDSTTAGYLFGIPYIISACSAPFLGMFIDKFGKRALLCCVSSGILIMAYSISMMMPECDKCHNEVYPLVLTGIGYSIYASAIWGSVPYVVEPHTVGTAFGLTTAIQNVGLVLAPTIVGVIKDNTHSVGPGSKYHFVFAFFILINVIGLVLNLSLYFIDINHNDAVLDSVDKGSSDEASPAQDEQETNNDSDEIV